MNNFAEITNNINTENIGIENFSLKREFEFYNTIKNKNIEVLNDRDLFFKISNPNENIDTTSYSMKDLYGMPAYNGQIMNNKKSLLSNPYIIENNEKNNFVSNNLTLNSNAMYAELDFNKSNNSELDIINNMAYNSTDNKNIDINENLCKIEKDIFEFEYEYNLKKNDEIIIDINSPFALAYVWKTIILLSKNPSTDKLLSLFQIKNKDIIINDMKKHTDIFEDSGTIKINIPKFSAGQTLNTNYINKIEEIYKIKIINDDNIINSDVNINLDYSFQLEIPFYYQPIIVNDYLINYKKNKIKFIELTDVPVSLIVDKENNIVILEIPFGSSMILGFVYDTERNLVLKIPYEQILQNKKIDHHIKKLRIPKINKNKKSNYSKKFIDVLKQIHLGEIIYGSMYKININLNMGLSLSVTQEISKNKYTISNSFDSIIINHKCFYYIKNLNIPNKILSCGLIKYNDY